MEFAAFADRAAEIEATSADGEIVGLVADLLSAADDREGASLPQAVGGKASDDRAGSEIPQAVGSSASDDDVAVAARFVQGRVFPAWSERTLEVGPAFCHEAIARAAGPNVDADDVERRLAEEGDVGAVAASYEFGGQRGLAAFGEGTDDLALAEVYAELETIAGTDGSGSREDRLRVLFGLFNRCSPTEARYLARLVLGEMRIGVGEGTVRDAIAAAFLDGLDSGGGEADGDIDEAADAEAAETDSDDARSAVAAVERALQVSNDYGRVAEVTRDEGIEGLDAMHLEVGRPVQAMLAQAGTVADALGEWDAAGVEYKFDGARVQLHHDGDEVRAFSRNMEEVTDALPEVVEEVTERLSAPAILDGEVVAVDEDGRPRPFQEVLRRFRRKHDVERARRETPLEWYAFDCLHADGDDLLDAPLTERHARLVALLDDGGDDNGFAAGDGSAAAGDDTPEETPPGVAALRITDDPEEIEAVETAALDAGHEGILLKDPDSTYTPGRRGRRWLKRKPDVETLDLVVTGAEWGEGRRANLLGTFVACVRDGDGGYATVGKVATGVTDEELAALTDRLEPLIAGQDGQDVSITPEVVIEVGYEEIQRSPTYDAGYALRFPRLLGVRDDLDPADADALDRVERLAKAQSGQGG